MSTKLDRPPYNSRPAPNGQPFRRVVDAVAWGIITLFLLRTWFVEGLFVPLTVQTGSMAETLLGPHRDVTCDDCGHQFVCGSDIRPLSPRAVCPNCGHVGNDLASRADVSGDRVLMHKSVFRIRAPRRWEIVAFRDPRQPNRITVKRVVGLPGEMIQIIEGNVYANGRIQRKPLNKQRAMAILVHEAAHLPTLGKATPPRWRADRPEIPWGMANGRFAHPEVPEAKTIDWLTYHHVRRMGGQPKPSPITDDCGYNQSRPRRIEDTNEVVDLLVSFRLARTFGRGSLIVRATDGADRFDVRISPSLQRFEVTHNGKTPPITRGKIELRYLPSRIEVSLFDRQLYVALNDRALVTYPYEPSTGTRSPVSRPLSIGSQGLGLEIRDLRVYRDVYYTHPIGGGNKWGLDAPVRLGGDAYYVLGDNSPISEDSRTWSGGPALATKLLLGKPFLVPFPARHVKIGPWHFQVPNPAGMRYIR